MFIEWCNNNNICFYSQVFCSDTELDLSVLWFAWNEGMLPAWIMITTRKRDFGSRIVTALARITLPLISRGGLFTGRHISATPASLHGTAFRGRASNWQGRQYCQQQPHGMEQTDRTDAHLDKLYIDCRTRFAFIMWLKALQCWSYRKASPFLVLSRTKFSRCSLTLLGAFQFLSRVGIAMQRAILV